MTPVSGSICAGTGVGEGQDSLLSTNEAAVVLVALGSFAAEAVPPSGLAHSTRNTPAPTTTVPAATPSTSFLTRLSIRNPFFITDLRHFKVRAPASSTTRGRQNRESPRQPDRQRDRNKTAGASCNQLPAKSARVDLLLLRLVLQALAHG